ncbi:TonB-dependent hemoglobin/transferrin/lactoferrin family receptor [Parahaliea mediterranea]|uniref:TonB-dependent hemoglobin/transferrin/lactoferrin family receptor n=1 Tax=Parahaliea mediterranea TaxID=651086 RepID=A0A939DFF6_9GAMM|nr:TonB-dependent hemoglobin/transferrin/lactoferrin family receptor [Parahaliea mediterranea]MBN7797211.1 TonB-dependent hemoglobin/transferrin/lactoferrin family receptor [Parahaliea mediterranea]
MSKPRTQFRRTAIARGVLLACGGPLLASPLLADPAPRELDLTVVESESIERDAVVDVITLQDISAEQIDNADDLVRYIPGVSVSRGDDRWGASGFNIRGLDEDRVAINVDGVPQGETLKYESGQAYGYFKGSRNGVDVEALKAVEIVKGADALFSGSGALAGAVNMTTKDPDDYLAPEGDDWGLGLKSAYSSENDETMATISAANRTGALESLLVYTWRGGHEFENHDMDGADIEGSAREVPDPQDRELNSVLGKLIYELSPGQEVGLVGSYYDRNTETDTRSYNGGWYHDRVGDDTNTVTRYGLFYNLEHETALFDTLSAAVNRQDNELEAITRQRAQFFIPPFFSSNENRVDNRSYDQELLQVTLDLEKTVGDHRLIYGLELQDKDYRNSQFRSSDDLNDDVVEWETENLGALVPRAEAEVYTLYGQDTFALGERTQLRLGLRYDDYSYDASADDNFPDQTGTLGTIGFDALTWTVGVEQAFSDHLSLEAGVSTGFRAPTVEEMYRTSGTQDDWNAVANPDLDAETSTNYDIALVGDYGLGSYRVGLFYSEYDDFIEYQDFEGINSNTGQPDPNGYQMPVNSDEVEMKGLELSATLDLSAALGLRDGLSTRFLAAYTEGEEANGDPVYSVQPPSAVWRLNYDSPRGNWGMQFVTSYTQGKKDGDSYSTEADGERLYPLYRSNTATVFDLVAYVDVIDNLRLVAGVYNLGDKEYYAWDSVRFIDQGDLRPGIGVTDNGIRRYSEPGRNFELSLNYQF